MHINPSQGTGPVRPQPPAEPKQQAPVAEDVAFHHRLQGQPTASNNLVEVLRSEQTGEYAVIRDSIRAAAAENPDKAHVLRTVVEQQVRRQCGPDAPDSVVDAAVEAYRDNPHLSRLFDRLYTESTRGLAAGGQSSPI